MSRKGIIDALGLEDELQFRVRAYKRLASDRLLEECGQELWLRAIKEGRQTGRSWSMLLDAVEAI